MNDATADESTANRIHPQRGEKVVTARAEAEVETARAQAQNQSQILAPQCEARSVELRTAPETKGHCVWGQIDLTLRPTCPEQPPQTVSGGSGAVQYFNVCLRVSNETQPWPPPR